MFLHIHFVRNSFTNTASVKKKLWITWTTDNRNKCINNNNDSSSSSNNNDKDDTDDNVQ